MITVNVRCPESSPSLDPEDIVKIFDCASKNVDMKFEGVICLIKGICVRAL